VRRVKKIIPSSGKTVRINRGTTSNKYTETGDGDKEGDGDGDDNNDIDGEQLARMRECT